MTRLSALLGMALVMGTSANWGTGAQEYRWWQDRNLQHRLSLTPAQVLMLEQIYDSTVAEQRQLARSVYRLEWRSHRTMAVEHVDETRARFEVDELEKARAKRNSSRSLMLLKMFRALTPEQRRQLDGMHRTSAAPTAHVPAH
jgi:Spy/CpxP family protein refolding chaperone